MTGLTHSLSRAKVSGKGQLSLPKVVMSRFNVEVGDQLVFYDHAGFDKLDQTEYDKHEWIIVAIEKSVDNIDRAKEETKHYL